MNYSDFIRCKGIDSEALLSFRSQGLFTDVKFSVNGKELEAHKIVLASRSNVFLAMFTSGLAESEKDFTISIDDIDEEAFNIFLEYMYTREESLLQSRPVEMLMCADKYNVTSLLYDCDTFFVATLSKENIYDYLEVSETFRRQEIKDRAIEYFREHIILLIHHRESWPRLQSRFDLLTDIILSYHRFFDYKVFALERIHWEKCKSNGSTVMDKRLSLFANDRIYSFTLEVDVSVKGTHVIGILDIVEKNINAVRMFVYLEILWEEELLIREKQMVRWSKLCGCDTGHLDVECWRFIRSPTPSMSPGPIIFAIPKKNIYDKILTIKIGMSSIRPQTALPCAISDEPLAVIDDPSRPFRGHFEEFGMKKYFDFMWEQLEPELTVENAASSLCRLVDFDCETQDDLENFTAKNQVLQFIKFHLAEVAKSKDWAVLESRPEILREVLLEIAQ